MLNSQSSHQSAELIYEKLSRHSKAFLVVPLPLASSRWIRGYTEGADVRTGLLINGSLGHSDTLVWIGEIRDNESALPYRGKPKVRSIAESQGETLDTEFPLGQDNGLQRLVIE